MGSIPGPMLGSASGSAGDVKGVDSSLRAAGGLGSPPLTLQLTQGAVTIISPEDADVAAAFKWRLFAPPGIRRYAITGGGRGIGKTQYLHRLIMNCPPGLEVDHINHDGLDNRRENLRICTRQQNCANVRRGESATGFIGVVAYKKKFIANCGGGVKKTGTKMYVGMFSTAEDAARARDAEAKRRWGEFATLNFPEGAK